jgi:hypothetical protein
MKADTTVHLRLNLPCYTFSRHLFSSTIYILLVLFLFHATAYPQQKIPGNNYQYIYGRNIVQSKNYYLLTLFDESKDVKELLDYDKILSAVAKVKSDSLAASLKDCRQDGLCYINRMKFTDDEIKIVSDRLAALYDPGNALGKLVQHHLIPSGTYILFQGFSEKDMLVKAWEQDAHGVNFALSVYAEGKKPNYPLIDSISFKTKDYQNNVYLNDYVSLLYNTTSVLTRENNAKPSFYSIPVNAALLFLEMNEREQAADFEPMARGENKEAFNRIKSIQWKEYKYSVILVPGAGPDEPGVALSAEGLLRCRLAAALYQKGLAPFIIPSGGKVHPFKTSYNEAAEMKKYMVEKLKIPSSAIIIEPHARHTTTNMRNAARLIFRYGIPFTMPGITCTTRGQSSMIGTTLIPRSLKELNAVPYRNGKRLSETEIEFYPLIEALHINPSEPMDP